MQNTAAIKVCAMETETVAHGNPTVEARVQNDTTNHRFVLIILLNF